MTTVINAFKAPGASQTHKKQIAMLPTSVQQEKITHIFWAEPEKVLLVETVTLSENKIRSLNVSWGK